MSSDFCSTALKNFDIPKALFMKKGMGRGEEKLVHVYRYLVTQENNVVDPYR